jgi:hypothetical protein
MKSQKTVRAFLKHLLDVADTAASDLTDSEKLTEEECVAINTFLATMQNQFGEPEFEELLKKYKLSWPG